MISMFVQLNNYIYRFRNSADDLNIVTSVAQGIMNIYKVHGKDTALLYANGYSITIDEDTNTGHLTLIKVTVTVTPKVSGLSPVKLISYNYKPLI